LKNPAGRDVWDSEFRALDAHTLPSYAG